MKNVYEGGEIRRPHIPPALTLRAVDLVAAAIFLTALHFIFN